MREDWSPPFALFIFPVPQSLNPIWVHPSTGAEEEKRTGRDLLCCLMGEWGWSCSSTLPWVSSLGLRRNPRSDQKTGPGRSLLENNEEQPWLEVTNNSQNLQHSPFDQIKPRELKGHLCLHLILIPRILYCWCANFVQCDRLPDKFRSLSCCNLWEGVMFSIFGIWLQRDSPTLGGVTIRKEGG